MIAIDTYCFKNQTQIKSVYIPDSVKNIGQGAFYGCTGLTVVNIPESVSSIGNYAFQNCSNLSVVMINNPDCTINISYRDTLGLSYKTMIVADAGSTAGAYATAYGYTFLTFAEYNSGCKDLEFTLSDDGTHYSVTGIGNCEESVIVVPVFYNGLPVTEIGEKAFANIGGVTSIEIPKTIKTIGDRAFYACADLGEVTIPASVTKIGTQIFYKADNLQTVYYNSEYYSSSNQIFSYRQKLLFQ